MEEDKQKVDKEKESNDEENSILPSKHNNNKRSFNVDSLLAPEKNPSKKLHYEQESNFDAHKETQKEKFNHNFKSKPNGHVANHANSKHHHLSLSSKQESNNQDVEKWKETFSKIMARSYKNHK